MYASVALTFAPRATAASVRKVAVRKLAKSSPVTLAPSAAGRIETILMGLTFASLAGLAILMEAVGTSLF